MFQKIPFFVLLGVVTNEILGVSAEVRFSNLYQDGMVLQREPESATIWGYGNIPKGTVASLDCTFGGSTEIFTATMYMIDENLWMMEIKPQVGGTSCSINILLLDQILHLNNVLFGDVYLCGGQSNMEFGMGGIFNATEEIEDAKRYENIRYTRVNHGISLLPDDTMDIDLAHAWTQPSTYLSSMSAVCFLYAKQIYDRLQIPLGLIGSYYGGTIIEAWSTQGALDSCGIDFDYTNCDIDPNAVNCNIRLYNKMINPLKRTTVKGFLWYQGESNTGYNHDYYDCSFPALINYWREEFYFNSNTNQMAPFGFVQLSTIKYGSPELGTSVIRWHQTADFGRVPNSVQRNVFMAVAIDTDDEVGGIHPRYKQIVAERLAVAGMNIVYEDLSFPAMGPVIIAFALGEDGSLVLYYNQPFRYDNTEISGFYYCCIDFEICDLNVNNWIEFGKDSVQVDTDGANKAMKITLGDIVGCEREVPHISYLWRQTPIKGFLAAPIYSSNEFRLPSAPRKLNFTDLNFTKLKSLLIEVI